MKTLNISNPTYFSAHRSGWGYVMNGLMKFHSNKSILLDDFLDITFGYNATFNLEKKIIPYRKPWIGFLHHPPHICPWYEWEYKNSIDIHNFLNTEVFLHSLEYCRGIFVLSNYLKIYLEENFPQFKNIPIFCVKHPTEFGLYDWNFDKFKTFYRDSGIKLLSIGYFLRNLSTIFLVNAPKKIEKLLLPSHMEMALKNLENEIKYKSLDIDKSRTKILTWQNNAFYDKILEQCVVLLDLYDTSCNNAIIESVIRNTPIIVNKHPAVIEYLGKNYPLYYKDISDIPELLNYDIIQSSAEYLKNKSKDELTIDYFISDFQNKLSLIDTDIKIKQKPKNNTSSESPNLLIKASKFSHRFGWEWAISNIKKNNTITNKNSNNNIYCNDFVEHTFRNEKYDNKSVIIDNKKYGLVRGYNFYSLNNYDVFVKDDECYYWDNTSNSWIKAIDSMNIHNGIQFKRIDTYKNNHWIGFLHNPINMPRWFDYSQNIKSLLHNNDFVESLQTCKILFVLSDHFKNEITELFKKHGINNVTIKALKHPVPIITEEKHWNLDMFLESKNITQIGYWMRKMHSFWELKTNLNKIWLYGDKYSASMLDIENVFLNKSHILNKEDILNINQIINNNTSEFVKNVYITKVNDIAYDKLLASSISYVNFYDCVASNTVVECIATRTPLLVNKLPSIVEYLGEEYPLYFRDINQASSISNDIYRIKEAHEYLKDNNSLRDQLNIDNFVSGFYKECSKICKK